MQALSGTFTVDYFFKLSQTFLRAIIKVGVKREDGLEDRFELSLVECFGPIEPVADGIMFLVI